MTRLIVMLGCLLFVATIGIAQELQANCTPKILIAYFSQTNNTKTVAEQIHHAVGGDLFQIVTKTQYPSAHQQTVDMARAELDRNMRPELATTIPTENMSQYDVVFIGYPIWWHTMPMAVWSFLEQCDLSGKTVIPFCTHEGNGIGSSISAIQRLAPDSIVLQGLAVRGRAASTAQSDIGNWLRAIRFIP